MKIADLSGKWGRGAAPGRMRGIGGARANAPSAGIDRLSRDLRALLGHLGRKLEELYGERYQGLVLSGSYVRGEADDGSGVDLLLLLEGGVDPVRELLRVQEVKWPLALEAGYTVSLLPVSVKDYERSQKPLLWNERREEIPAA